ncbi:MAG: hypothetical protein WC789_10545 [Lentisphaeria bacterium]
MRATVWIMCHDYEYSRISPVCPCSSVREARQIARDLNRDWARACELHGDRYVTRYYYVEGE